MSESHSGVGVADSSTDTTPKKTVEDHRRENHARARHRYRYWRDRDKETYECPDCGATQSEIDRFEVHHIDENPLNGDSDNLLGLCRTCHLNRHGREYNPLSVSEWKDEFLSLGE